MIVSCKRRWDPLIGTTEHNLEGERKEMDRGREKEEKESERNRKE